MDKLLEWKARTPSRVFRAHNVDLPHTPRPFNPRSNAGSSPETSQARAARPAAAQSRAPAARPHVAKRTKAEPGPSTDATGNAAAAIPYFCLLATRNQARRRRVLAAFAAALCRPAEPRLRALRLTCAEIAE